MSVTVLNQKWHLITRGEKAPDIRRPWLGRDVEMYKSKEMFGVHEERQFLEQLGPWMLANIGSRAEAEAIQREGWKAPDGSMWYLSDGAGFVRDEGAVFVLTNQPMSRSDFFQKLGLRIDLESKWNNSFKVGKYLKRLWSPHKHYIQGRITKQWSNGVILVELPNGKQLLVRYINELPNGMPFNIVDGMNLISKQGIRKLGHKAQVGSGFKITGLSPLGFSKGHAIVLDGLDFDLVLYGSKELLKGDKFTFAVDELNPGNLFTDIQSILNFRLYEGQFMENWTIQFFNKVIAALDDEDKLRSMLQFYKPDFHKDKRGTGDYIDKEKDWALLRALRAGVKISDKPALVRKVFHLFISQVMDCRNDMRIPIPEEVGLARYIMVDPTVFTSKGDVDLSRSVLKGEECYCPGTVGEVTYHRQPNAHRGEHWNSYSVHNPVHTKMDTGTFMFVAPDRITEIMKTLGGGDQDDRVCIYKDQQVVEHIGSLPDYKLDPKVDKAEPVKKPNVFGHWLRKPVYDTHELFDQLAHVEKQRLGIGRPVNALMFDTAIIDMRNHIMADLRMKAGLGDVKAASALVAMQLYDDNRMRGIASRLEDIIDAIKKTGGDLRSEEDAIKAFYQEMPVCIRCMAGRLPDSLKGENQPFLVDTPLDSMMSRIEELTVMQEHTVIDLSWDRVGAIPMEITTYPTNPNNADPCPAEELAREIKRYRGMEMGIQLADIAPSETKKRIEAFTKEGGIDHKVYLHFKDHPFIIEAMAELWKMQYSEQGHEAPRDKTNKPRLYPDSILWGPYMSGLTMKMLDAAELTKRYVFDEEGEVKEVPAKEVVNVHTRTEAQVFTVVAGLAERGASPMEIAEWHSHKHEYVILAPYTFFPEDSPNPQPAVNVILKDSGREYGNITRKQAPAITEVTEGWLAPGKSPRTMLVVVKGE